MPLFTVETNIPKNQVPNDFVIRAASVLSKTLGKPKKYCLVAITPEVNMSFAGTTMPCAIANVKAIGHLGVEENKRYAKILFEFLEKELGVSGERIYISFHDTQSAYAAHNGKLFLEIYGK